MAVVMILIVSGEKDPFENSFMGSDAFQPGTDGAIAPQAEAGFRGTQPEGASELAWISRLHVFLSAPVVSRVHYGLPQGDGGNSRGNESELRAKVGRFLMRQTTGRKNSPPDEEGTAARQRSRGGHKTFPLSIASRIVSSTPSIFSNTFLFGNLSNLTPSFSKYAVRSASYSARIGSQ